MISGSLQAKKSCVIDEYKNVERNILTVYNAFDAINVTDAITEKLKQKAKMERLQIIGQLKLKTEEKI